jgi:hypothetical protein
VAPTPFAVALSPMHETEPLYRLKGDAVQLTACACASEDHPRPLIAISAAARPASSPPAGRGRAARMPAAAESATRLPPGFPRARETSEAATQAPRDSFQRER